MATKQNLQALLKQWGATYPKAMGIGGKKLINQINTMIREAAYRAIPTYQPGASIIEAQSGYITPLNMKGILSLRFQDYYYPEQAAHGVTGVSSITVNLSNGYQYHFNELFQPNSNYQAVINQIITEQISTRQIPMLKPFEGVGPRQEYYLTPDSLVVYYQPYVYTPGYFGVPEFAIPFQQIRNIIDPRGPIGILLA